MNFKLREPAVHTSKFGLHLWLPRRSWPGAVNLSEAVQTSWETSSSRRPQSVFARTGTRVTRVTRVAGSNK
eukprot:s5098_g2.t1